MSDLLTIYNRYRLLIFPVLIGISILLLIIFVVYPQVSGLLKGQSDIANMESRQVTLLAKVKDLDSLSAEDLKSKMKIAVTALPIERDYPGTIGLIQNEVAKNGLELESLQVSQVASIGGQNGYSLNIGIFGPKENFNKLLTSLGKTSQILRVTSIEVSPSRASTNLAVILTLDAFYAPAPNNLGPVEAPVQKLSPDDEKTLQDLAASQPQNTSTDSFSSAPRGRPNPFE